MKWLHSPVLLVCVICLSCAAGGGPSGTGISSSTSAISGNVIAVQAGTATTASTTTLGTLPPIQVSIVELPQASTEADSGGNFMLSGNFAGALTLRFTVLTVPQFQVTQQLDVPAGSAVVLQNIELQPGAVVAQAARQLNFFGTVDVIDCPSGGGGTLQMHDRRSLHTQFLVDLNDQTSYVDAAGQSQSCAAISVGSVVAIDGSIAYSADQQTITALVVTTAPLPLSSPPQEIETHFSGALAAVDCTSGLIVVDDSVERTTVQLTAQTRLMGASGAPTCQSLQLGDRVGGEGQINLSMPGVIVATKLVVMGPPNSGQSLRLHGFVTTINCAAGALQLRDNGTTIDLQLSPATVITGHGSHTLTCADIQPGDRVNGLGQVASDGSHTLDALQIMVTGSWLGKGMKP